MNEWSNQGKIKTIRPEIVKIFSRISKLKRNISTERVTPTYKLDLNFLEIISGFRLKQDIQFRRIFDFHISHLIRTIFYYFL